MKKTSCLPSNVFLEDHDPKFDAITILNPSWGIEVPLGDNMFSADYAFWAHAFGVHSTENHLDQMARGLFEINLTDYKITVKDVYERFSHRSGTEDLNRIGRQTNDLRTGVSAQFDQLGFDIGYSFGIDQFLSDKTLFVKSAPMAAIGMTYDDKDRLLQEIEMAQSIGNRAFVPLSFRGF